MSVNLKKLSLVIVLTTLIIFLILRDGPPYETGLAALPAAGGSSRLSELLSDQGLEGYAQAIDTREFKFPQDHGPPAMPH